MNKLSLQIQSVQLRNFRSYENFYLGNLGRLTIFVGPNAVGKTSIIEGIQLLTALSTLKHCDMDEVIYFGAEEARVSICAADENRQIEIALKVDGKKRSYTLNGKPKRVYDLRGLVPAVTFSPDDLSLIKGASSARRRALDSLGIQLNANYQQICQDFEKIHKHKTRLLKEEASADLLAAVNETFVQVSAQMTNYRRRLFERILPHVQKFYAQIVAGEAAGKVREDVTTGVAGGAASGLSAAAADAGATLTADAGATLTADAGGETTEVDAENFEKISGTYIASWESGGNVYETLAEAVENRTGEEATRERVLEGAHLDKVNFFINGLDSQKFASQGQQRSLVLAWKLAEVELIGEMLDQKPILLLDDVMSELDAPRRAALMNYLKRDLQVFITTTNAEYFTADMLKDANVVQLPLVES